MEEAKGGTTNEGQINVISFRFFGGKYLHLSTLR